MTALQQQGAAAKAAGQALAIAGTAKKNRALEAIADILTLVLAIPLQAVLLPECRLMALIQILKDLSS